VAHRARVGGWWPGEWSFPTLGTTVALVLSHDDDPRADRSVTWIGLGSVLGARLVLDTGTT
jgi:hypothetical protein